MPNGMTNYPVTAMAEDDSTNPIDAAAEITDAMMSSLADVVKNVITSRRRITPSRREQQM